MFISIIVPVYKVERYLEKFLDSMLSCRGALYEVILILRDSEDKCVEIAKSYKEEFKDKIELVYQEGEGLSNARNCGIKIAKGKYVVFFDSDDLIDDVLFSSLLRYIKIKDFDYDFDILISDYKVIDRNGNISYVESSIEDRGVIEDKRYLRSFLHNRRNYWNVWQYIYRLDFILKNDLFFIEGIFSEDIDYSTKSILKAERIFFSHLPYYEYRIGRVDSLANNISLKHISDLCNIIEKSILEVELSNSEVKEALYKRLLDQYILSFVMIYDLDIKQRREAIRLIESKKFILAKGKGKKYKFIRVCNVFIIATILKFIRYIRRRFYKIH
jgi:hypothetical protein